MAKNTKITREIAETTVKTENSITISKSIIEKSVKPVITLFNLRLKTFYKSPGMIFTFVMPVLFLLILGSISPNLNQQIGSLITMNMMSTILFSFGQVLVEWKESIVIKRIGATPIKRSQFMTAMFMFSLVFVFISITWTLIWSLIFQSLGIFGEASNMDGVMEGVKKTVDWSIVNWGALLYGIAITVFMTFAIATIFMTISNTTEKYQMFAQLYYMISIFGAGIIFTPAITGGNEAEWLTYLGYIMPHAYAAEFNSMAFGGYTDVATGEIINPFNFSYDMNLYNFLVPLTLTPIFSVIALKRFTWD